MNPFLPLNEYVPDGEPHLFEGRVYLYGSHDRADGTSYCEEDYVCYSCPEDDLNDWRYEGVMYRKTDDPDNRDGLHKLYAPDVVFFKDRYWLYYFIESVDKIAVAVSDKPQGPFTYYGDVCYPQGMDKHTLPHYPSSFDPAILNDDGHLYLSYGFSIEGNIPGMDLNEQNTMGGYVVELEEDMLTMKSAPKLVVPGFGHGKDTSFEGHEFLEASSLKHFGDTYYFIYSSQNQHELCYATSRYPDKDFEYQGILISNSDKYKADDIYRTNWANNHGSVIKIKDEYYIFYHRHTYGKQYSRQACFEKITFINGLFEPAVPTSGNIHDLNEGIIEAARACLLYDNDTGVFIPFSDVSMNAAYIKGNEVVNITHSTVIYRYLSDIDSITFYMDKEATGTVRFKDQVKPLTEEITFTMDPLNHEEVMFIFDSDEPVILKKLVLKKEK